MYNRQQDRPSVTVWRQFAHRGYCAFASLHRQVRIGVLSVATLSVAAQAHAEVQHVSIPADDDNSQAVEQEMTEVTVSGTMAPLTQLQSARIVGVLSRQDIEQAGVQSINDLFKLATGVDVRQRGGFGIQTDISIDGGTFDQVTLLLNGIDITSPQTGHLSADIPVSISDIERIEVLEGAASRVYGGQSFGGAINIVTRRDRDRQVEVGAQGGSFGTAEADARLTFMTRRIGTRISGGGGRSDGGTTNSEWRKGQLYYQGDYEDNALRLDWQFGFSKKNYGANTFYSAAYPDQYERNERYLTSISAETKGRFHFTPSLYWQRNFDNFELTYGKTAGENFHLSDAYGLKAGGYFNWIGGKTAVSAAMRHESIFSTNLGRDLNASEYVAVRGEEGIDYKRHDDRTTVSFSLEHNILLQHWTISAGLMANRISNVGHRFRFYPGVDIAYRPASDWKLFLSYNKGYRLPSFTELYYKSPTHEGNQGLQPEHNHSLQLGTQYRHKGIEATLRGFYHRGDNMIDWVMYSPDDTYHSAAFGLDNLGVQATARLSLPQMVGHDTWIRDISAGYTFIHQNRRDAEDIFKSNYAMEYLRHKFVASVAHRIYDRLSATWSVRWQDRMGGYVKAGQLVSYSPYATLDVKLQWTASQYQIFLQGTNITDHHYYDIGNVEQPGIWVMAGARLKLKW